MRTMECRKTLKNYRRGTLLNSIYKSLATIITSRQKQIVNMLTKETQRGHKIQKAKVGIIFVFNEVSLKKIRGRILLELPKAFGKVDRENSAAYYMKMINI